MEQLNGTITRNVTTTLQAIDIAKIFGTREVVCINNDEDGNIFYNPNPNGVAVLTADVAVSPDGLSASPQTYVLATAGVANFVVGDLVTVTTQAGAVYETKITAVDTDNDAITIEAVTDLVIDDTDAITAHCYKLPSHIIIRSGSFQTNKFLVKHKDSTATDLYQLVFIDSSIFASSKAPFFFAK